MLLGRPTTLNLHSIRLGLSLMGQRKQCLMHGMVIIASCFILRIAIILLLLLLGVDTATALHLKDTLHQEMAIQDGMMR